MRAGTREGGGPSFHSEVGASDSRPAAAAGHLGLSAPRFRTPGSSTGAPGRAHSAGSADRGSALTSVCSAGGLPRPQPRRGLRTRAVCGRRARGPPRAAFGGSTPDRTQSHSVRAGRPGHPGPSWAGPARPGPRPGRPGARAPAGPRPTLTGGCGGPRQAAPGRRGGGCAGAGRGGRRYLLGRSAPGPGPAAL